MASKSQRYDTPHGPSIPYLSHAKLSFCHALVPSKRGSCLCRELQLDGCTAPTDRTCSVLSRHGHSLDQSVGLETAAAGQSLSGSPQPGIFDHLVGPAAAGQDGSGLRVRDRSRCICCWSALMCVGGHHGHTRSHNGHVRLPRMVPLGCASTSRGTNHFRLSMLTQAVSLANCPKITNAGVRALLHGTVTGRSLKSLDISRCAVTGAALSELHVKVGRPMLRAVPLLMAHRHCQPCKLCGSVLSHAAMLLVQHETSLLCSSLLVRSLSALTESSNSP
jgi:hypothetical protein